MSSIDLNKIAEEYKANLENRRIVVCAGTACVANGSLKVIAALEEEIKQAGISVRVEANHHECGGKKDLYLSKSGCHGFCQQGPLVTIMPENILYVKVKPEDAKEIVRKGDNVLVPGREFKNLYGYRFTKIYSRSLVEIVKEFAPDIIHNQTDSTIGQFARILSHQLNVPLVYTYHTSYEDYTYYATKGYFDRFAKQFVRNYSKNVANTCAEFITPSMKTKEYMRFVGSDIYMNIIPTGIDFTLFDEDKQDKEKQKEFKEKHGINENTHIFLILGRIAKEKSMDFSIRGFAKYHERVSSSIG